MSWIDSLPESIPPEARAEALEAEASLKGAGASLLVDMGLATAEVVLLAQARFYQRPYVHLSTYERDPEVEDLMPLPQQQRLRAVPLFKVEERLYLAVTDPEKLETLDLVARLVGCDVEPVLALDGHIETVLASRFVQRRKPP